MIGVGFFFTVCMYVDTQMGVIRRLLLLLLFFFFYFADFCALRLCFMGQAKEGKMGYGFLGLRFGFGLCDMRRFFKDGLVGGITLASMIGMLT